jgi:3-deoxy-D-manno-octulosonic-acid transferase
MAIWIYNLTVFIYGSLVKLTSLFNHKAQLWVNGRKDVWEKITFFSKENNSTIIWFHVSSLGEFEQGRPVIEQLKKEHPEWKIVLTFFSPSGYEIRKNYPIADAIFYLPIDTPRNAKHFYELIKPQLVVFVKYDFWYHYIHTAYIQKIPIILISAVFKPKHIFFKRYGGLYRKMLSYFSQIFVQDESSASLLKSIQIKAAVAGDTRCDRVLQIAGHSAEIPVIKSFVQNSFVVVVGSAWLKDIEILTDTLSATAGSVKWIIAPHKIDENTISEIQRSINVSSARYSKIKDDGIGLETSVLLIDNIGMLSSLYQYAQLAYIGGGFGKGIHNTLEPAVYGIPVIFGPCFHKFVEAIDMITIGAAFSVSNEKEFKATFNSLYQNNNLLKEAGIKAGKYIMDKSGATKQVVLFIDSYFINLQKNRTQNSEYRIQNKF